MTNRRKLLVISVLGLILVMTYFIKNHEQTKSPLYKQLSINPDTGQQIITTPNQSAEGGGVTGYVTILGANKLITAGMTQSQLLLSEHLLTIYVNSQLHAKYKQVAILNSGFSYTGNYLSSKLRLGNSSILLPLAIKYQNLNQINMTISTPNNSYYYTSGWLSAPTNSSYGSNYQ